MDSGVAQHLAKEAIEGYLKKRGKTILFVTNQLQFLPMADKVIFMDDGEIAEYGTFEELKVHLAPLIPFCSFSIKLYFAAYRVPVKNLHR